MGKPKITLINPLNLQGTCSSLPPLGLMYLASYLRGQGYDNISIIDLDLKPIPEVELDKIISSSDVVGVTGFTTQINDAFRIAKICKKNNVFSVIGGVHAIALPLETLKNSSFDIVVTGEGEVTFLEVITSYLNKKGFDDIPGIGYRKNGTIRVNPPRDFISDLDSLPFPAWDLVPIHEYHAKRDFFSQEYTIMITSRGCPAGCTFCQSPVTWKRQVRFRSVDNIFSEIKQLYQTYGFRSIFIEDDTFTLDRRRVEELTDKIIDSGMLLEFACGTRPNTLDLELLKKMKKAGWVRISIGAESANKSILKRANKGYTALQIREATQLIRSCGISFLVYMIIGLPGESLKTYWESVVFARSLKADQFQWTILVPFPGTQIFINKEVEIIDKDFANWTYWHPVIRIGFIGPMLLLKLLHFAELLTKKEHNRRNLFIDLTHVLVVHVPLNIAKALLKRVLGARSVNKLKNLKVSLNTKQLSTNG